MPIDQYKAPLTKAGISACWRTAKAGYRTANVATHYTLGAAFKLLVVLYFLFCILILGLRYVLLPNIDSYKPEVERLATRAIGNQVSIGAISATWSGLRPQLSLDTVVLHDEAGRPSLTLPQLTAVLSWWSLPRAELRLHRLEIQAPDLDARRDADGRLYVGGVFIDAGAEGDGKTLDWVLSQREIVIRDGRLRWNDQLRAAPELVLEDVDFVLQNRWRRHRAALKARPPAAFAAPLDVRARFDHGAFSSASKVGMWKGELYADLRDTDLAAWRAYIDYPVEVRRGKGSVQAWLDFNRAKVADFTAELKLSDVSTRLRKDLEPLNLAEVSGRISVREDIPRDGGNGTPAFGMNGHSISLSDFSLHTEDGLFLPPTTISESYAPARNGQAAKTEVRAQLLDLQTVANFAERLPLPLEQRRMLDDFAPRGTLHDFVAEWHGSYPEISAYRVKGDFARLSLQPRAAQTALAKSGKTPARAAIPAIPGFNNLSGSIDASERGGKLNLDSENLNLQLPAYASKPEVAFDRLAMQADWAFEEKDQLRVDVKKFDFVHEGMSGAFSGTHLMPLSRKAGASPGVSDIKGTLSGLELRKVGAYLPLQTSEDLRQWLAGGLVGGAVKDVEFRLKGDLANFPFDEPDRKKRGEFKVTAKIDKGVLNYGPGEFAADGNAPMWPLIDEINGTITFDRARMEIRADSARTSGTVLSDVKVAIPDLTREDMLLTVDGKAAGPLENFVRFTNASPVAGWIGHFTEETRASGNAKLDLKLELPLDDVEKAKVNGVLHFSSNNVTLQNALPPLTGTSGQLAFNEKGFSLGRVKSNFIGGPVTISGGTQPDGSTLVKAEGHISAAGLGAAYSLPPRLSRERVSGSTAYVAHVRVKGGIPNVTVESDLAGIALDFPAPLNKRADEILPFRLEVAGSRSPNPATTRDTLSVSLGSTITARYEREKILGKDKDWRVLRGGIGVNVPAPQPDSGLIANVSIPALNIDAWQRAVESISGENAETGVQEKPQAGLPIAQYVDPDVLAARTAELIVMDRKLDNVVVGASQQQGVWQANIDSAQASGYLTWFEPKSARGRGKVTARLASLTIPKSAASEVTELLEGSDESSRIPALDISVERFELFGKQFGHLDLLARNARGETGWEWQINKLRIANPDGVLEATGKWASQGGDARISSLDYSLDITNAGRLLTRFGFADLIRGGKGKMEGDISWKGMPFSLDIPSLSGQVRLNIEDGQFLKVDQGAQGAAKLLGVLSLQSLPRRLALDFRDVFSEGFAFDSVVAQATVERGVAKTDNFKMRGVSATVLIDGTADIAREQQDLHVVVIPEINAGAASIVYGLAVNPVIGVGTFLAQLFLRDPLMKAFTFEYLVTGPWTEPEVTKLKPVAAARNPVTSSGSSQ